jgi:hypothetical protein
MVEVGREREKWKVSATNRANPFEVWGKFFPTGESARAEACDLGLIDRMKELASEDMTVTNAYYRRAEIALSPDLLIANGFERLAIGLTYRGTSGIANVAGELRNRTALPSVGELIPANDTPGLAGDHRVKNIGGPFVTNGRITYWVALE